VRSVDLVDADKRHPLWLQNFRRICSKQIDFVVCDAALCPLLNWMTHRISAPIAAPAIKMSIEYLN
jgi:hypothetical protein